MAADDSGKTSAPAPGAQGVDHVELFERMTFLAGKAQQMMMSFWSQETADGMPPALDPFGMAELWPQVAAAAISNPMRLAQMQMDYVQEATRLWEGFLSAGEADAKSNVGRGDKRFTAEAWENVPVFQFIKQAYLLTSRYLLDAITGMEDLSEANRQKAIFFTQQFVDALSPTNYALTNPDVLKATVESGGENLLRGTQNMLDDIARGRMRMTDEDAFQVGVNVAATPGQVVFENRLFQLIQYKPTTAETYAIPLLIFPPWINKFYILDLTAEKSYIRWCLDQGLAVYIVSWKNADESLRDVELDHYVREGFLTAIDKVLENTSAEAVNLIGYCVAGTTLAAVLALLEARGEAAKVESATFFTAQVDFTEAGDLKVFVDDNELALIEQLSGEKGYLDGRYMATTFNMLRSNDLIWNYVVNNYLLGKDYLPFDLLYWNSDATNVPGRWHLSYLRDLYRENKLVEPGAIVIDGTPIDLSTVKTPVYIQAGKEDHIAPLASVWKLTEHFAGPIRFTLAGSGHIAGVVNPPAAKKYQHWTMDGELPATLEEFEQKAEEQPGSWWPDWMNWLSERSGKKIEALQPGDGKLKAIEPAPGRYVKERIS